MTKEQYGEYLKTQAAAGVDAKAAEERRREALTDEERAAEDKAKAEARAAKGAETKKYKEYLAKMEAKGETPLPKEAWLVKMANSEARTAYKDFRKALIDKAKSGNTTESPEFFQALIGSFTELANAERARLEALREVGVTAHANRYGGGEWDFGKDKKKKRRKTRRKSRD